MASPVRTPPLIDSTSSAMRTEAASPIDTVSEEPAVNAENADIQNRMSSRVKDLAKAFGPPALDLGSSPRNGNAYTVGVEVSSDDRNSAGERKSTPRREISARIRDLSNVVEPVVKALANREATEGRANTPERKVTPRREWPYSPASDRIVQLSSKVDTPPEADEVTSVPDAEVAARISYLLSDITRLIFDAKRAAGELSDCILLYPHNRQFLITTLIQLRERLKEKHVDRFNKVFVLLMVKAENGPFLVQYFKHPKANLESFASTAARRFAKHPDLFPLLCTILSSIMSYELRFQKRETLFRDACLSSALFREFGGIFCSKELEAMKENIAGALKRNDPALLCLDYKRVREALLSKNSALEEAEQKPLIETELEKNADRMVDFAFPLLQDIFALQLSPGFCELLALRRRHIVSFLQDHPKEADEKPEFLSRSYISEVICLRFLIPQILSIHPSHIHTLVSLTKVVQCLTTEETFGTEKFDPIYKRLSPLFDKLLIPYCYS